MPYRLTPWIDIIKELLSTLVAFVFLFLAPIKEYVYLVFGLIILDFITGGYASYRDGEHFTAKKMRRTIEKFFFYSLAIIAAYILQKIIAEGVECPRIVALFIGATELKSIYENISRITGTSIFRSIWDSIKSKVDDIFLKIK